MNRRQFCNVSVGSVLATAQLGRATSSAVALDYQVLARSTTRDDLLGSPGLTRLPDNRLVATYEHWQHGQRTWNKVCKVLVSTDGGQTWQAQGAANLMWATPFVSGDSLYLIGNLGGGRQIGIARSDDGGRHWTEEKVLFVGRFTNAPTSVVARGKYVYRAFEATSSGEASWKSFVVAGDTSRDLLDRSAWRMSSQVPYPGTPPALTQGMYPPSATNHIPEDGWLEGNVVEVRGKLKTILRVRMQGQATVGICGVCDVEDDGEQFTSRFAQFCSMPGGQGKFQIVHDRQSTLYWTAVNPASDPFQPPEPLWQRGFFGGPGNERRLLVLMYSLDALSWFQAGYVALSSNMLDAFSYASLLPDGNDMLVLARTSVGAANQHDTNLITFHRVKNFRGLVPEKFFPSPRPSGSI